MTIRTLTKKLIPTALFRRIEPFGHLLEAVLFAALNGFPARNMHVIGVTGTNGKTTTTALIHKMLHEAGYKVAMLSTVQHGVGDDITPETVHMTTASAPVLQKHLKEFKKKGAKWVVIETSSHSLAQHRVWGIPYEIAVMTNVTGDHLDYHGTFENYLEAKRRLFMLASRHGRKFGIVNADDANAEVFTASIPNSVTYGVDGGALRASNIQLASDHSTYTATIDDDSYDITMHIPGAFNVSNSLAAVAVGRELGLSKEQIEQGIAATKTVEGRMMTVDAGQEFGVIIDYASTPDGFEKFFEAIRPSVKGKLIAVFGSAGRRDEAKRPMQGEIAGRFAEEVIITEEDDRDIDGNQIMNEIAAGSEKAGKIRDKDLFLILDRTEAINFAMTRVTSPDDCVVLLGKGHEKTIERAHGEESWNEVDIAKQAINSTSM